MDISSEEYSLDQDCPSCGKTEFRALKENPEYGFCVECCYDNELEFLNKK